MNRLSLTFVTIIIAVVYVVFGHHGRAEAKQARHQGASKTHIEKESQTNQQKTKRSQARSNKAGRKNRRQRAYKPERNKLGEGKGKKSAAATKKKGRKGKKAKTDTTNGGSEGIGKQKRVKVKKTGVSQVAKGQVS